MIGVLGVVAFVLVVVELVAAGVGVLVIRRAWRQVAPQVRPLLSMLAPAPPETIGACDHSRRVVDPAGVERCADCPRSFGLFDPYATPPPTFPRDT